jgi:hypothetical protein
VRLERLLVGESLYLVRGRLLGKNKYVLLDVFNPYYGGCADNSHQDQNRKRI